MKKLLFLSGLTFLFAVSGMASITTCPTASYDNYLVPGFTCSSGNLLFGGFGFTSVGTPGDLAILASAVSVTPTTADGNEGFSWSGFPFVSTQANGQSSSLDAVITFTVFAAAPGSLITDLHVGVAGQLLGATATIGIAEQYCFNGPLTPGCAGGNLAVTDPPNTANSVVFPGVASISVSKDINSTSGTFGVAHITSATNSFSNSIGGAIGTPEPMSFVLLGSGLLGLGLLRKKLVK